MENQNLQFEVEKKNDNKKYTFIPYLFGITIIFFFFNFFTVSCESQQIANVSGIDLVIGVEKNADLKGFFDGDDTKDFRIVSFLAIAVLIAAAVGLIGFIMKTEQKEKIGFIAGVVGFSLLLIIYLYLKSKVKGMELHVQVEAKFPFWGAVIAMGAISYLCQLKKKEKMVQSSAVQQNE